MVTIYQVAAEAKVSASIVSRILNDRPVRVTEETRSRVLAVASELRYVPNSVARSLRQRRSDTWTLLIPTLEDPVLAGIAHGVTETAQASGHQVAVTITGGSTSRERASLDTAEMARPAGLIVVPGTPEPDLSQLSVPVVAVLRPARTANDQVIDDTFDTARRATATLLEAGHRRIACLPGTRQDPLDVQRLTGYRQAFTDAGLDPPADLVRHCPSQPSAARAATCRLLDGDPLDAILLASTAHAIGAVEALGSRGIDPASGPALFACDSAPWTTIFAPFLSVAKRPGHRLGRTAAQFLLDRISDPTRPPRAAVLASTLDLRGPLATTWTGARRGD
ncbi:LacI family DNA-binding transcriptional regulator [Kribbella sancticallisti]|uniref:LacI family DNA-binding transcriptional regulator n=1 Tax=Kribbella sancticallisti TaxID=460087 RepID=A0ABN2DKE2_9ACTN